MLVSGDTASMAKSRPCFDKAVGPPPKRPQEEAIAKGPRPYRQQAVTFDNAAVGVRLAGTLSVPDGKRPFPAVVLMGGSGPGARDENGFGHKMFLVLADVLNRRGIAVLRYDKRGVGESSNHMFQTARIGTAAESVELEETLAPSALKIIADWGVAHSA